MRTNFYSDFTNFLEQRQGADWVLTSEEYSILRREFTAQARKEIAEESKTLEEYESALVAYGLRGPTLTERISFMAKETGR